MPQVAGQGTAAGAERRKAAAGSPGVAPKLLCQRRDRSHRCPPCYFVVFLLFLLLLGCVLRISRWSSTITAAVLVAQLFPCINTVP